MIKCTVDVGKVGASRLRSWDPKDPSNGWMDILKEMAANREQC